MPVEKEYCDAFIPYSLLRYDLQYQQSLRAHVPRAQVIEAANVYRPAVLVPCYDRSSNFGKVLNRNTAIRRRNTATGSGAISEEDKLTTSYIRMWGIPYKTIDRAGYDITFPSMEGHALFMPDDEINEIYAIAGEEEALLEEEDGMSDEGDNN